MLFHDLAGSPNNKDDLKVFIKLILQQKDKDLLGKFPIHGVILLFDCNRKVSLENLQQWLFWCDKSVRELIDSFHPPLDFSVQDWGEVPIFVIGNKLDLIEAKPVKMKSVLEGKIPIDKSLQTLVNMTTKFLSKKFAFTDFENLLILSRLSDGDTLGEIDSWVKEVYLRTSGITSEFNTLELQNYTVNRCIGWNNVSMRDNLRNGFFGFFRRLFNRDR